MKQQNETSSANPQKEVRGASLHFRAPKVFLLLLLNAGGLARCASDVSGELVFQEPLQPPYVRENRRPRKQGQMTHAPSQRGLLNSFPPAGTTVPLRQETKCGGRGRTTTQDGGGWESLSLASFLAFKVWVEKNAPGGLPTRHLTR